VAQRIQIPVEFTFEIAAAVWRIGIAKPVGWSSGFRDGPVLEIVEPAEYCGIQSAVSGKYLPQLSEQMSAYAKRYEPWPLMGIPASDRKAEALSREIERDFGQHRIELLLCDHPEKNLGAQRAYLLTMGLTLADLPSKTEKIDAWKLREEFFQVKRNMVDLARFLNRWGSWSWENGLPRSGILSDKPGSGGPSFVFADSIWSDQDALRTAHRDPATWLSHSLLSFEARNEFPHFVRRVSTCRDAIVATITFDMVQGSKFRFCALKDCRAPFKLESGHKKKFCCQYHAHLASVRRNRKLAAKSKARTAH
jgi:hypothetical protein